MWRQHSETCPEIVEWDWCHKALTPPPPSSWWRSSRLVGCVTNRLQEDLRQQDMRPFSTCRAKWWPHHISSFVYSEFGMQVDGAGLGGISHSHLCSEDVRQQGFWLRGLQSHLKQLFSTLGLHKITASFICPACDLKAFYASSAQFSAFFMFGLQFNECERILKYKPHKHLHNVHDVILAEKRLHQNRHKVVDVSNKKGRSNRC